MLYANSDPMAAFFQRLLRREYRSGWKMLKPQLPKRLFSKTEIDPISKRLKVTLKYKFPRVMKKVPLRKMPLDFSSHFKWWYFDGRTKEAVIVLDRDGSWETIRVFDPMWLTNLSRDDIYTLYKCQIFFQEEDALQALQYHRVIRLCFAYDVHNGVNWKEKQKEIDKR